MKYNPLWFFLFLGAFVFAQKELTQDQGFLPKEELGILEHLKKYPTHDGRGVIVAVIDTGVDLNHPGLQKTSTGQRKIIDFYDATGAGRLNCTVKETAVQGKIRGLSGYLLDVAHLPAKNQTFQLGILHTSEFFPSELWQRVSHEKQQQEKQQQAILQDQDYGKNLTLSSEDKEIRETPSSGYHLDVLMFETEAGPRAIFDTDNDGDLSEESLVGDFASTGEIVTFKLDFHFSVGVTLYPAEQAMDLLFDGGGHGTHVAGIIGAYYQDGDSLNGLAPGVQILSIKIGNNLYNSATTDLSLIRAVDYAVRKGAQLINCSFGGPSFENNGHEITSDFITKMLEQHRFLMCISAGNEGPALGTIGSPGTSELAFAVGACISPKTQNSNYSVIDVVPPLLFPFSSRGPLRNGDIGIDFIAPGAAYSPIPTWQRLKHANMNGTSMAAPQLSGALAVLISGLQEEKIVWTNPQIRNALERTAKPLPHISFLEQGWGLPQIPRAFELLKEERDQERPLHYRLNTKVSEGSGRGAFFKNISGVEPFFFNFQATPLLSEDQKIHFSRQLSFASDVEWLKVASYGIVTQNGISVRLKVLPHLLTSGINFGRIFATRLDGYNPGHEFYFPVTILQPTDSQIKPELSLNCKAGERHSFFYQAPFWATHLFLEAKDLLHQNHYALGIRTLSDWTGGGEHNSRFWKTFTPEKSESILVPLVPGELFELSLQSQFSENQNGLISLKSLFLGLEHQSSQILFSSGQRGFMLGLGARGENLKGTLQGKLTHTVQDLPMSWSMEKAPRHADLLTLQTLFLQKGTGSVLLKRNETVQFEIRYHPVFFDFLDDAYLTITDPHQRIAFRAHVTQEKFEYQARVPGTHTLTIFVVTLGRTISIATGVFSVELQYPIPPQTIQCFKNPSEAFAQESESGSLDLKENVRTTRYLFLPELDRTKRYRGTLEFKEERFGKLLDLPILVLEAQEPITEAIAKQCQQEDYARRWEIALQQNPPSALDLLKKMETLAVVPAEDFLKFKVYTYLQTNQIDIAEGNSLLPEIQKRLDQDKLSDPEHVRQVAEWFGWKIRILQKMSRMDEAEKIWQEWRHLDFKNPHFLYFEYDLALQRKEWERALSYLKQIEDLDGTQLEKRLFLYEQLQWKKAFRKRLPDFLLYYPNRMEDYLQKTQQSAILDYTGTLQELTQKLKKVKEQLRSKEKD